MIVAGRRYVHAARIGARIAAVRQQEGLRQSELARRMGISRQVLNKVEQGTVNTTVETLMKIARALGVPVVDFLHDDDGMPLLEGQLPKDVLLLRDLLMCFQVASVVN
jgi:transcriptional regulator with XRE-family HTH domain